MTFNLALLFIITEYSWPIRVISVSILQGLHARCISRKPRHKFSAISHQQYAPFGFLDAQAANHAIWKYISHLEPSVAVSKADNVCVKLDVADHLITLSSSLIEPEAAYDVVHKPPIFAPTISLM